MEVPDYIIHVCVYNQAVKLNGCLSLFISTFPNYFMDVSTPGKSEVKLEAFFMVFNQMDFTYVNVKYRGGR